MSKHCKQEQKTMKRRFTSPKTRRDKIEFLAGLMTGKTSLKYLLPPITGMIVCDGDKNEVYTYSSTKGRFVFDPPITREEFNKRFHGEPAGFEVSSHDYSEPEKTKN